MGLSAVIVWTCHRDLAPSGVRDATVVGHYWY